VKVREILVLLAKESPNAEVVLLSDELNEHYPVTTVVKGRWQKNGCLDTSSKKPNAVALYMGG
jgi:hypothetical protein